MLSLTESLFCLAGILKVTDENCQDLLEASNMLQLSGALSFCCAFLKNQMHTSNCIGKTFFSRKSSKLSFVIQVFKTYCKNILNEWYGVIFFEIEPPL